MEIKYVSDGERVVRKGKLAELVLKQKKEHKEKGKRLASKSKKTADNANTKGKNVLDKSFFFHIW